MSTRKTSEKIPPKTSPVTESRKQRPLIELSNYVYKEHHEYYEKQKRDYYQEIFIYTIFLVMYFFLFQKKNLHATYSFEMLIVFGVWAALIYRREFSWRRLLAKFRGMETLVDYAEQYMSEWESDKVKEFLSSEKKKK